MKNYLLSFIGLFFLQIFIFNKIFFFNALIVSPIILFFLTVPHYKNSFFLLNLAFFAGLLLDIFNDSLGIYSLGFIFLTFIRNYWIDLYFSKDTISINTFLSSKKLELYHFFYFSFPLIIFFQSFIYLIEIDLLMSFPSYLLKIFFSSCLTFIIILILQSLFFSSTAKHEWD